MNSPATEKEFPMAARLTIATAAGTASRLSWEREGALARTRVTIRIAIVRHKTAPASASSLWLRRKFICLSSGESRWRENQIRVIPQDQCQWDIESDPKDPTNRADRFR